MLKKQRSLLWLLLMPFSLWGITISTDTILTKDVVYNEDVIIHGAMITLNNHTITINGDLNITIAGDSYPSIKGIGIKMIQKNDKLIVKGNINFSGLDTRGYLTNGVIEVSGNFYQREYWWNTQSFYSTDNHKVILNGNSKQVVNFGSGKSSQFNHLEIKNTSEDGVEFNHLNVVGNFKPNGNKLTFDNVSNLNLSEDYTIPNDLNVSGTIYLNGHTLTVDGNLRYEKYSKIRMTNPNDRLVIDGNLDIIYDAKLTNGTIELKGNFYHAYNIYYNNKFQPSTNHKVILNGTEQQKITFSRTNYAYFYDLEILNEQVVFNVGSEDKIRIKNILYTTDELFNNIYKNSSVLSFKEYRDINYAYIELKTGQHLITLPVENTLSKSEIETVFSDKNISYILKHDFDSNEWQGYSTNTLFKEKMKNFKVRELNALKAGDGIIIDVTEPITLKFPKSDGYSLFDKVDVGNLASGWHLLGSNRVITIEKLLAKNSNIKVLWSYQEGKWSVYSEDEDIKEEYRRREIPTFEDINNTNSAFWLYVE